jgi:hypothetical protein
VKITVYKALLLLLLFSLISQLGKHFWPYFSFVSGIRVDYLSPTVYFSDCIIAIIFVKALYDLFMLNKQKLKPPILLLVSILLLAISIIVSKYAETALYGAIKALEMVFVSFMVSRHISIKDGYLVALVVSGAVFIESLLIGLQTLSQGSIGGVWYFLGERTFSVGNIGVSTVSAFGKEYLRAYGTFPHPNVLAFFLLMSSLVCMYGVTHLESSRNKILKYWFIAMTGVSTICLLLTFSRSVIISFIAICVYIHWVVPGYKYLLRTVIVVCVVFILLFFQRFGIDIINSDDVSWRLDLARIAINIALQHPIFGVGINNFFYYQIDYQRTLTPVLLQPPHSIYLLTLLHFGFIGLTYVGFLLFITVSKCISLIKARVLHLPHISALLVISALFIGLVDHYFVTLQQGMLMVAFLTGMMWIPVKNIKE